MVNIAANIARRCRFRWQGARMRAEASSFCGLEGENADNTALVIMLRPRGTEEKEEG